MKIEAEEKLIPPYRLPALFPGCAIVALRGCLRGKGEGDDGGRSLRRVDVLSMYMVTTYIEPLSIILVHITYYHTTQRKTI